MLIRRFREWRARRAADRARRAALAAEIDALDRPVIRARVHDLRQRPPAAVPITRRDRDALTVDPLDPLSPFNPLSPLSPMWVGASAPPADAPVERDRDPILPDSSTPSCDSGATFDSGSSSGDSGGGDGGGGGDGCD